MNIIYIHGLDSDANSTKGRLLEDYCRQYHPNINVLRPDLNKSPAQVCEQLLSLIKDLDKSKNARNDYCETVLVGSSLGGYFSTLISNYTGCPALLLNPSTQPHITLQRFADTLVSIQEGGDSSPYSNVLHTTAGGWLITPSDLQWFAENQLVDIHYPKKIAVFIKEGDELLNPELAKAFYQQQGATVIMQAGGDHRFSDFDTQLPIAIDMLQELIRL